MVAPATGVQMLRRRSWLDVKEREETKYGIETGERGNDMRRRNEGVGFKGERPGD